MGGQNRGHRIENPVEPSPEDRWLDCPHCGHSVHVPLSRMVDEETTDPYDVAAVYCPACAARVVL